MQDISLRNLTESRGFEDEKTEDAVHQCSACGMHDDICPSGQCACTGRSSGGGTPENGVTAQEATAAETIPFEGTTITKGGNYEIQAGPYNGNIKIDTTQPVNIAIKGNVTFNGPDPFINVAQKNYLCHSLHIPPQAFIIRYTALFSNVDSGYFSRISTLFSITFQQNGVVMVYQTVLYQPDIFRSCRSDNPGKSTSFAICSAAWS